MTTKPGRGKRKRKRLRYRIIILCGERFVFRWAERVMSERYLSLKGGRVNVLRLWYVWTYIEAIRTGGDSLKREKSEYI